MTKQVACREVSLMRANVVRILRLVLFWQHEAQMVRAMDAMQALPLASVQLAEGMLGEGTGM